MTRERRKLVHPELLGFFDETRAPTGTRHQLAADREARAEGFTGLPLIERATAALLVVGVARIFLRVHFGGVQFEAEGHCHWIGFFEFGRRRRIFAQGTAAQQSGCSGRNHQFEEKRAT